MFKTVPSTLPEDAAAPQHQHLRGSGPGHSAATPLGRAPGGSSGNGEFKRPIKFPKPKISSLRY